MNEILYNISSLHTLSLWRQIMYTMLDCHTLVCLDELLFVTHLANGVKCYWYSIFIKAKALSHTIWYRISWRKVRWYKLENWLKLTIKHTTAFQLAYFESLDSTLCLYVCVDRNILFELNWLLLLALHTQSMTTLMFMPMETLPCICAILNTHNMVKCFEIYPFYNRHSCSVLN